MAEEESAGETSEEGTGEGAPGAGAGLTEEELAMLEQQMRELTVDDLLTQTVVSVLNLTARRIGKEDEIDLDQARTGIEAVRALMPLLPDEIAGEIREPLSQIQMLYASRTGGDAEAASEGGAGEGEAPSPEQPKPTTRDDGGGSGLWTPPGA